MIPNANKILFRCHSLGHLMKEPQKASHKISADAKKELIKIFVQETTGRRERLQNKYLKKGIVREEDSITLYSRVKKKYFKKNEERIFNKFLTGIPDMCDTNDIHKCGETFDAKSAFSAITYYNSVFGTIDPIYEWQGHGYMFLTGAEQHTVVHSLVNGTAQQITDEKYSWAKECGVLDMSESDNQDFIDGCQEIERNHIFDMEMFQKENRYFDFHSDVKKWKWNIPMEQRIHEKTFKRDKAKIEQIKNTVMESRAYMNLNFFKLSE